MLLNGNNNNNNNNNNKTLHSKSERSVLALKNRAVSVSKIQSYFWV